MCLCVSLVSIDHRGRPTAERPEVATRRECVRAYIRVCVCVHACVYVNNPICVICNFYVNMLELQN